MEKFSRFKPWPHKSLGFSMIEVMFAVGIMSVVSIGLFKIIELSKRTEIDSTANFEIAEVMQAIKKNFYTSGACKNTFVKSPLLTLGDFVTEIRNIKNEVIFNTNFNQNYVKIISFKIDNLPLPAVPLAASNTGPAKLYVTFKKNTSPVEVVKSMKVIVGLDANSKLIDCASDDLALSNLKNEIKNELCAELGGSVVAGVCQLPDIVLCSNKFNERGVKNTISTSFSGGAPVEYVKYKSTGMVFSPKNCGVGNVNDSAFASCMGPWSSCGGPSNAATWPVTEYIDGLTCTKISFADNLEWCGGGGNDGSWAKYSCAQNSGDYTFNLNCDTK